MPQEYVVAQVEEVPEGHHLVVAVNGREIGIFNVRGQYYALPNACFHQNGPLCRGHLSGTLAASAELNWKRTWVLEGEVIVCPWHALEFHVTDGRCLAYPQRKLPTWPVKVAGAQLILVM